MTRRRGSLRHRPGPSRAGLAVLLAAAAVLTACSAGPDGSEPSTVELSAVFDDVRHLAPRHAVRVADVRVGTVRVIELDRFQARVTLEIDAEHRVPEGATAAIRQASLLGENFVELRFPPGVDPRQLPALPDGATIEDTETVAELEDLARRATEVLGAFSVGDIDTILETLSQGLGSRGEQLNVLVERAADLAAAYAARSEAVGGVLDDLNEFSGVLAAGSDDIAAAIEEAERATASLARQRERTVGALEGLTELSRTADEVVLGERGDQIAELLENLRAVSGGLAAEGDRLADAFGGLERFTQVLPAVAPEGRVHIYSRTRTGSGVEQPIVDLVQMLMALVGDDG